MEDVFFSRPEQDWVDEATANINKVFPGFADAIEAVYVHKYGPDVSASHDLTTPPFPEKHPNIDNLCFAGDYVEGRSAGVERAADVGMRVAKRILRMEGVAIPGGN